MISKFGFLRVLLVLDSWILKLFFFFLVGDMSSSSNNYYNSNVNNINNEVYPFSLYLSSLSNHQDIISNPYNHQLIASPGHMVSAVPESLSNYMAFSSSNNVEVSKGIKKPVKKDRHSKIYTAQGLRDRRVRLSIGIARQFFDLQDMLGFDKASKTLDWLLKKSRNSIQEVVEAKRGSSSIKNSDEDNGNNGGDLEENEEDQEEEEDEDKSSSVEYWDDVVCEVKKPEKSNILSKGLRGKAKEKTTQSETLNPFLRSINFNEGEEKLSISIPDSDMTDSVYKEAFEEFNGFPRKEISNQESILPKRKIDLPIQMGQSYNQQSYTILNQNLGFDYDQNSSIDQSFCSLADMNFGRGFS